MFTRFIELITILLCILIFSSCAMTNMANTNDIYFVRQKTSNLENKRSWNHKSYWLGRSYTSQATYDKDFAVQVELKDNENVSFIDNIEKNITYITPECKNVKVMLASSTKFYLKFSKISDRLYTVNSTKASLFDEPKPIEEYIPVVLYPKILEQSKTGVYFLKEAINYQWCQGYVSFIHKYNKSKNEHILYNINMSILSDTHECTKWFGKGTCLSLHYDYDIDIIDNKTKTSYFTKKLTYIQNTTDTIGDIEYDPIGYYIETIVEKNREVIENEVFTDELYNTLSNALQNSTTH